MNEWMIEWRESLNILSDWESSSSHHTLSIRCQIFASVLGWQVIWFSVVYPPDEIMTTVFYSIQFTVAGLSSRARIASVIQMTLSDFLALSPMIPVQRARRIRIIIYSSVLIDAAMLSESFRHQILQHSDFTRFLALVDFRSTFSSVFSTSISRPRGVGESSA